MKAANNFIQAQEIEKKGAFRDSDPSLVEAKIISVGDNVKDFKKAKTILFPAVHGKVMQHSIKGIKYYFVDKDVILAVE